MKQLILNVSSEKSNAKKLKMFQISIQGNFPKKMECTLCNYTQKMKFSIKDFFSKCDQIRSFLQILSFY